jgi:uncharacterized protein with PQ loop repeat
MNEARPLATLIGSIGVTLLLVAFFLNVIRVLRTDSTPYIAMNLAGAVLAGVSSYLIGFLPFVVLEAAWALVASVALVRRARK